MKKEILILIIISIISASYMSKEAIVTKIFQLPPKQARTALKMSGTNIIELKKVISHYKDSNQPQKLKATYFLLQNMIGKGSIEFRYFRNNSHCTLDSIVTKNLKNEIKDGKGRFKKSEFISDLKKMSSEYLISNIDQAFHVWRTFSWCQDISFNEFCHKILPYRVLNEPLSDWRKFYYSRHKFELDSLNAIGATRAEVCFFINKNYMRKYIKSAASIPGAFSHTQFEEIGGGTCDHLAHNAVLVMRACGIPLNLDVVCFHGKINGGHVYNSLDASFNNEFIFFSPYEREPERREWRAHRIMRLGFEGKIPYILKQVNDINKIPGSILKNPYYSNVTSTYFPTTNLSIEIPDKWYTKEIVYLCTYNSAKFQAIDFSFRKKDSCKFTKLTKELLYFPMFYIDRSFIPAASPFIIRDSGQVIKFEKTNSATDIKGAQLLAVKNNITQINKTYLLYYWDNKWKFWSKAKSGKNKSININNIPKGTLYLLRGENGEENIQRPFSFLEEEIEYW